MHPVLFASTLLAQVNANVSGGFAIIPCGISLLALALWIAALVDAIKNPGLDGNKRLIWVLVIIFVPFIGPILYFLIGRQG